MLFNAYEQDVAKELMKGSPVILLNAKFSGCFY